MIAAETDPHVRRRPIGLCSIGMIFLLVSLSLQFVAWWPVNGRWDWTHRLALPDWIWGASTFGSLAVGVMVIALTRNLRWKTYRPGLACLIGAVVLALYFTACTRELTIGPWTARFPSLGWFDFWPPICVCLDATALAIVGFFLVLRGPTGPRHRVITFAAALPVAAAGTFWTWALSHF